MVDSLFKNAILSWCCTWYNLYHLTSIYCRTSEAMSCFNFWSSYSSIYEFVCLSVKNAITIKRFDRLQ